MANLVVSVLAAAAQQSRASFVPQLRQIESVQEKFLLNLLRTCQNTQFGRDHGLADIKTIDQYRDRVPVRPYSYYEPYARRMANGEPNMLTPDPAIYVNISSGSTGARKYVPVTKRSRQMRQRANQTAAGFLVEAARQHRRPLGTMLLPISVKPSGSTEGGIPCAPVSTSDLSLQSLLYHYIFPYPYECLKITDSLARNYICLLFGLRNANLRTIAATFPVLALQLCSCLEQNAESLIQDLEAGTIASWLKLDPKLRLKLERQCSAMPQRAACLRQALRANGKLTPKDAWQNLSYLITSRGGTSDFYFERFPEYFGDAPIFGGTYACAEGVLGLHHNFNTDGTIPPIHTGFFEFMPQDQWDETDPKTLLPWEVKPGEQYRIVFTNYSGFYRYDLGDVVEIEGFYEQAPLMIFRHRRGGVLSSSTEKTTEAHVVETMRILQQQFDISLENFCITLLEEAAPSPYLVNVELASGSTLSNPEKFLQSFDDTLKTINLFYEMKRRDQIPLPRLRILAPGSFEQFRQRRIQKGAAEAQFKFPHVSEDRNLLEGLRVQQEIGLELQVK